MSNISDKDIDRRFREAAEGANFPFDDAGWADMTQRLENNPGFPTGRVLGTSLVILALIGSLYWGVKQTNLASNPANENATVAGVEPSLTSSVLVAAKLSEDANIENTKEAGVQTTVLINTNESSRTIKKVDETKTDNIQQQNNLISNNSTESFGDFDSGTKPLGSSSRANEHIEKKDVASIEYSPDYLRNKATDEWIFPFPEVEIPTAEITEDKDEKPKPATSKFAIKLQFAPDVSSVGYFKGGKVGNNFGISIDYQLSKKLRLSAGAIHSRKYYSTTDQVSSYGYYGAVSTDTERLDGDCKILDVPISMSYLILTRSNSSVFVSGGLSSYFMLSERYQLTKNDSVEWDRSYSNENNHIASIFNLSFGYERAISKNLSFQFEPFIKMPVKDIGEGKVDLVSSGAFLNLRYKLK
uniref:hypothetical protein n=1 Tax=Fulvivirga sp. TaxID=1931237 RepID=UPI00404A2EA6